MPASPWRLAEFDATDMRQAGAIIERQAAMDIGPFTGCKHEQNFGHMPAGQGRQRQCKNK